MAARRGKRNEAENKEETEDGGERNEERRPAAPWREEDRSTDVSPSDCERSTERFVTRTCPEISTVPCARA